MKKLLALVLVAAMGLAGIGCDKGAGTTKASSGGPGGGTNTTQTKP